MTSTAFATTRQGLAAVAAAPALVLLAASLRWGFELVLPQGWFAPLGLSADATYAVAALLVPVLVCAVALAVAVLGLRTPGVGHALTTLARRVAVTRAARWMAVVALGLGAPIAYLAIVMPSIVSPLSPLDMLAAFVVPGVMVAAALVLASRTLRRAALPGAVAPLT